MELTESLVTDMRKGIELISSNMKIYIFAAIIFSNIACLHAQSNIGIKVIDGDTKVSIYDAVVLNKKSKEVGYSNINGICFLPAEDGDSIVIRYLGYDDNILIANTTADITTVELNPTVMDQIVISAQQKSIADRPLNVHVLDINKISKTSFVAGEPDIMQALQFLPGVSNTREALAGIVVRGGLPDQNSVIFDGIRIYNYGHIFGFVSLFNGDVVKNVSLYKGNIPPKYGGMASSVIDIELKDGNHPRRNGKFSIGLISSRLYYNLPIIKDKFNIVFGARFSYLDLITIPMKIQYNNGKINGYPAVKLNDITLRSSYKISNNNELTATVLRSRDLFRSYNRGAKYEKIVSRGWNNTGYSLGLKSLVDKNSFLKSSLSYYGYQFFYDQENQNTLRTVRNSLKELSARVEYDTYLNSSFSLNLGINHNYTFLNPYSFAFISSDQKTEVNVDGQQYFETSVFQKLTWRYHHLRAHIGLRETLLASQFIFSPRLSLSYQVQNTSIHASFDKNYQKINQFQPVLLNEPVISWFMNENGVATSDQYAVGVKGRLSNHVHYSVEGFTKKIKNVPIFNKIYNATTELNDISADDFDSGEIKAYGIEGSVQFNTKYFIINSSYTYLISDTYWQGVTYPTDFSRNHELNSSLLLPIGNKITCTINHTFKSGQPITLPTNSYLNTSGGKEYIFTKRNNARYPDYTRLDLNIEYKQNEKNTYALSIYNLLNRRNPFHIAIDREDTELGKRTFYKNHILFGILPTIAYTRSF